MGKKSSLWKSRFAALFWCTLIAISIIPVPSYAQLIKKSVAAARFSGKIILDGKLDDPAWQTAGIATDFIVNTPVPGIGSAQVTEVRILYDDNDVYIGAVMHDTHPDSILKQLTARDDYEYSNTDAFGVVFDTYSDNQNAFAFVVTAAGVQADAKVKFDGFDYSWNAAWYSKVAIADKGWSVEMRIPYSALRFPKSPEQKWSANFFRTIRRSREKSYWNEVKPGVSNFLSQTGSITGIHDIISPIRLALLPYVSAYGENYAGANAHTIDGGMDIKYGINESFTLDMTLVPDFGQTLYDNTVLNLSPIEVRYDDRRYFFTEGLDLFNKDDLFYSRRVGGTPVNYSNAYNDLGTDETITANASTTKLYNATKISGRTSGNLGIGFFNAVSGPAYATALDTITGKQRSLLTSPLTNYNVVVLDQALKNNSYISVINTNVSRRDTTHNANCSAVLFRFADKQNAYGVDGSLDVSQLFYTATPQLGYRYLLEGGKTRGNYTWALRARSISDNFNPNDLGYLDRNNLSYYLYDQYYNTYKPFWIVNTISNHLGIDYYRVFNPDVFQSVDVNGSHGVTFRNYLSVGVYWDAQPATANDYLEPRTPGRFYLYPKNYLGGGYFSSDYRKRFALDGEANYRSYAQSGRVIYYWSLAPRFRFNDKFSMVYGINYTFQANNVGYVDNVNDSIYFGTRNIATLVNTLDATYIFNSTMSLKLDARHYWSQAKYSTYSLLGNDGRLDSSTYNTSHDINFNTFNIYLSYVWQFKPGSEMSVVYQNSIYSSGTDILNSYFNNLNTTFQSPQSNSLSVKIIYYLDYIMIKNAMGKGDSKVKGQG